MVLVVASEMIRDDGSDGASPWWIFSTVALALVVGYCLVELSTARAQVGKEKERALAAVAERRTCGQALDWCQEVARGTCGLVVDVLRGKAP